MKVLEKIAAVLDKHSEWYPIILLITLVMSSASTYFIMEAMGFSICRP